MKRVLQSNDKRTVRRRLQKLKESSAELGVSGWVEQTETNLPKLLPYVGSVDIGLAGAFERKPTVLKEKYGI